MKHKAGFVNIVGNPNVGKSTLMNQLVGERISIATFKAQTTRHRIMGIVNSPDMQIVFSDTPGVLKPNYKLQESMLAFSESALTDADVLLYVTDVIENPEKNMDFLEKVKKMETPVILLINKIDELKKVEGGSRKDDVLLRKDEGLSAKVTQKPQKSQKGLRPDVAQNNFCDFRDFCVKLKTREAIHSTSPFTTQTSQQLLTAIVEKWHTLLPNAEILPISAKNKFGVDLLLKRIEELLPENPAYFDKDQLTDKPARFFVSEIIREKILLYYDKEIPYSVEVAVESFKEYDRKIVINAIIYVERESQKGIIIGHQGVALKKVSTEARKALERFFDKHIFLEVFVKVDKDWRSSSRELENFGYREGD